MAKAKDFKFRTLVADMKHKPLDDKLSSNGRDCGHVTNYKFWGPHS